MQHTVDARGWCRHEIKAKQKRTWCVELHLEPSSDIIPRALDSVQCISYELPPIDGTTREMLLFADRVLSRGMNCVIEIPLKPDLRSQIWDCTSKNSKQQFVKKSTRKYSHRLCCHEMCLLWAAGLKEIWVEDCTLSGGCRLDTEAYILVNKGRKSRIIIRYTASPLL